MEEAEICRGIKNITKTQQPRLRDNPLAPKNETRAQTFWWSCIKLGVLCGMTASTIGLASLSSLILLAPTHAQWSTCEENRTPNGFEGDLLSR